MNKMEKLSRKNNAFFDSNVDYLRSKIQIPKEEKRKVRALPDLEELKREMFERK